MPDPHLIYISLSPPREGATPARQSHQKHISNLLAPFEIDQVHHYKALETATREILALYPVRGVRASENTEIHATSLIEQDCAKLPWSSDPQMGGTIASLPHLPSVEHRAEANVKLAIRPVMEADLPAKRGATAPPPEPRPIKKSKETIPWGDGKDAIQWAGDEWWNEDYKSYVDYDSSQDFDFDEFPLGKKSMPDAGARLDASDSKNAPDINTDQDEAVLLIQERQLTGKNDEAIQYGNGEDVIRASSDERKDQPYKNGTDCDSGHDLGSDKNKSGKEYKSDVLGVDADARSNTAASSTTALPSERRPTKKNKETIPWGDSKDAIQYSGEEWWNEDYKSYEDYDSSQDFDFDDFPLGKKSMPDAGARLDASDSKNASDITTDQDEAVLLLQERQLTRENDETTQYGDGKSAIQDSSDGREDESYKDRPDHDPVQDLNSDKNQSGKDSKPDVLSADADATNPTKRSGIDAEQHETIAIPPRLPVTNPGADSGECQGVHDSTDRARFNKARSEATALPPERQPKKRNRERIPWRDGENVEIYAGDEWWNEDYKSYEDYDPDQDFDFGVEDPADSKPSFVQDTEDSGVMPLTLEDKIELRRYEKISTVANDSEENSGQFNLSRLQAT